MHGVLEYAESKNGNIDKKEDVIQRIITSFLTNSFFPWLCIIFIIINRRNWKKPVIIVLLIHYILRSSCDFVKGIVDLKATIKSDKHWPYHENVWYLYGISMSLSLLGEIVGDWYPLLRTKAVIKNSSNKKKLMFVYITCIFYNITKIFGIYCYFMKIPMNLNVIDDQGKQVKDKLRFYVYWWTAVLTMQIASFFYDLSVIYALNTCLFKKIKLFDTINNYNRNNYSMSVSNNSMNNNGNGNDKNNYHTQEKRNRYSFLEKFKHISELRIIISMAASIVFVPFLVIFVTILIKELRHGEDPTKMKYNMPIEQFRNVVISINFTFMYIDQILMKSYVAKGYNTSRNKSLTHFTNFTSSHHSYNKILNISQNQNETFKCDYDPYNSILSPESAVTLAYNETDLNINGKRINTSYNDFNNSSTSFINNASSSSFINNSNNNNNSSSNSINNINGGNNGNNSNINDSFYFMSMINEEPYTTGMNDDSIPIFGSSPISPKKSRISNILTGGHNDDFYYTPLTSPLFQSTSPKRKSHIADIVINHNDNYSPLYPSSSLSPTLLSSSPSTRKNHYNEDAFPIYSSLSPRKTFISNIKPYDY